MARSIPLAKNLIPSKGKMQSITQVPNPTGQHKLTMNPEVRKQSRALEKMLQNVKPLQVRANYICKNMSGHYKSLELLIMDLADTTYKLSQAYTSANTEVNLDSMKEIGELYGGLSQVCADWERVHKIQRNTFFKNFRNMFGTSLYEEQGLESVSQNFYLFSPAACQCSKRDIGSLQRKEDISRGYEGKTLRQGRCLEVEA